MNFLAHWTLYVHAIDDIVDRELKQPKEVILTFGKAIELYTHPFFLKNLEGLKQVTRNVTAMYIQTVEWEKCGDWRGAWSDYHRHCSMEMVVAVATICGGLQHAAAVMPELRIMAYQDHHDREGKPI